MIGEVSGPPTPPPSRCPVLRLLDWAWVQFARRILVPFDDNLEPLSSPPATHPVRRNPAAPPLLIDCQGRPLGHPDFCLTCEFAGTATR